MGNCSLLVFFRKDGDLYNYCCKLHCNKWVVLCIFSICLFILFTIFKKILVDIGKENFLEFMKLKVADAMAHELKKDTKYAIDYPDKIYKRFKKGSIKKRFYNKYSMYEL